jgi:hypothetical protein
MNRSGPRRSSKDRRAISVSLARVARGQTTVTQDRPDCQVSIPGSVDRSPSQADLATLASMMMRFVVFSLGRLSVRTRGCSRHVVCSPFERRNWQ